MISQLLVCLAEPCRVHYVVSQSAFSVHCEYPTPPVSGQPHSSLVGASEKHMGTTEGRQYVAISHISITEIGEDVGRMVLGTFAET